MAYAAWIGQAILKSSQIMSTAINKSVCYRTGELTKDDYVEAIASLKKAMEQKQAGHQMCAVCSSIDHLANECHHNPLVLARRVAQWAFIMDNSMPWRCFHCGQVFWTVTDAEDHFGITPSSQPKCIRTK